MARGEVGRRPTEMEQLQSVSRGIAPEDEASSLLNPAVQERFRAHIAAKLERFEVTFPERTTENSLPVASTSKRKEELSIILLDFRKLREGCKSSGRVDDFVVEVYESSVRYAIKSENWQQLGAAIPSLVFHLHPLLASRNNSSESSTTNNHAPTLATDDSVSTSFAALTLGPSPPLEQQPFFQSLYLLHLIFQLSDLASFHPTLSNFLSYSTPASPLAPSNPAPVSHNLEFTTQAFSSLISNNPISLSKIIYPPPGYGDETVQSREERELQISIIKSALPRLREAAWGSFVKSYKEFGDLDWVGRVLLFAPDEQEKVKEFLRSKGKL